MKAAEQSLQSLVHVSLELVPISKLPTHNGESLEVITVFEECVEASCPCVQVIDASLFKL